MEKSCSDIWYGRTTLETENAHDTEIFPDATSQRHGGHGQQHAVELQISWLKMRPS